MIWRISLDFLSKSLIYDILLEIHANRENLGQSENSGESANFKISTWHNMKGKHFLVKPPREIDARVMIHAYKETEVDSGHICRHIVDRGALRISLPADLQSSDILDSPAQGRGLIAVKADPKLTNRRKRRFARFGSAITECCIALLIANLRYSALLSVT